MFNYISERFAAGDAATVEKPSDARGRQETPAAVRAAHTRRGARAITARVKAGRGSTHGGVCRHRVASEPAEFCHLGP